MTKEPHSLTVASDVANLEIIADFVIKAAQKAKLDEKDIFAIQVAVDEACTNVIEYAYGDAPGDIHLTCLTHACLQQLWHILAGHRSSDPRLLFLRRPY